MKKFTLTLLLLMCCLFINSKTNAQSKESDEVIKVDTNLVSIPVVVNDRNGRYIPNLKQSDFSVFQDGTKQDISFFASVEEPVNVALMLDTSKSTQGVLGEMQDAADDFIKMLKPSERATIVTFDYQVNTLCPLTSDRQTIERAIDQVDVGEYGGTVMRDAVDEVISKSFAGVKGRRAIILLTDGKDSGSSPSEEELLKSLEESDVMIYSIFYDTSGRNNQRGGMGGRGNGSYGGYGNQRDRDNGAYGDQRDRGNGGYSNQGGYGGRGGYSNRGDNFPNQRQQDRRRQRQMQNNENAIDYLSQMSELTAGRLYQDANVDLQKTFALIADELKKQYRIGYYPKEEMADNDAIHQIKVKVNRDDVAIRARSTYRTKQ